MTAYRLWPSASGGALVQDNAAYTMGMQFTLSAPASLTGIWWWSPSGAQQLPSQCCVFAVSGQSVVTGTLNASPAWSGAAGSGWVRCAYDGSVTLAAATGYKVAVLHPGGGNAYGATPHYWDTGDGAAGISSGPLTGLPNASSSPGQDSFTQLSTLAYPATSFNATNYWADVEVTVTAPQGGITVTAVPQAVFTSAPGIRKGPSGQARLVNGGGSAVWLGGSDVSPASGIPVAAGGTWAAPLFPGDEVWAVTASGTSAPVYVMQTGS